MVKGVAFSEQDIDVAAVGAALAEDQSVAVAQRQGDAAFAGVGMFVAVEIGDDLLF